MRHPDPQIQAMGIAAPLRQRGFIVLPKLAQVKHFCWGCNTWHYNGIEKFDADGIYRFDGPCNIFTGNGFDVVIYGVAS